jgi:hypothetical protein
VEASSKRAVRKPRAKKVKVEVKAEDKEEDEEE